LINAMRGESRARNERTAQRSQTQKPDRLATPLQRDAVEVLVAARLRAQLKVEVRWL
jgi:hypothetical protein